MSRGSWIVGLAVGTIVGSCSADAFLCESDEGCAGLSDAKCEPDGYCSVPDQECRSGRRYAPSSGPLSDRCVPEGESTGTGDGPGSTAGDSTGAETLPTIDDSGDGTMDGDSTGPIDPTDPPPEFEPCGGEVMLLDDFSQPDIDFSIWTQGFDGTFELAVEDGVLTGVLPESMDAVAYSWLTTMEPNPPVGTAGMQVVRIPEVMVNGETFIFIQWDSTRYGFSIFHDQLETFESQAMGMYTTRLATPFDPESHRWLRLNFDDMQGSLTWEVSGDASRWSAVDQEASFPDGWSFAETTMELGSGIWDGPFPAQTLSAVDNAFVCAL